MGIRHLIKIEEILRKETEPITIYGFTRKYKMTYPVLKEALFYLESRGWIKLQEGGYVWAKKK